MSKYVVFEEQQFEEGIEEMATMMYHGGYITRRELGEPLDDVIVIPAAKLFAAIRTINKGAQNVYQLLTQRRGAQ